MGRPQVRLKTSNKGTDQMTDEQRRLLHSFLDATETQILWARMAFKPEDIEALWRLTHPGGETEQ